MDEVQRQLLAQLFSPEDISVIEAWCRTCDTTGMINWMRQCLLQEIREHWGEFGGPEKYPGRPEDLELLERFCLNGFDYLPFVPPPEQCPDCGGSIRQTPRPEFTIGGKPVQQLECQACNWWTQTPISLLQRQNQLHWRS